MAMNKDFGPFLLEEKIGHGAMASVYLATQKSLQRQVVLKVLYPHLAEDEKLIQRFEREARAAAMMRHENIIQVIDCGRYDDVAYICMEFVEGMDLKKWIEAHGTPPLEMAVLMLRDLCRGLEHAHGHRIVHRDIKPANIMFTPEGTIKIMDFGLARGGSENATQMTMVGSVLGTPAYMSPEQATGEVVDQRSDIFSTGVVAYELLGGSRPFIGDSYSSVMRAILTVEAPDVSHLNPLVPEDVARIVRGMLQKDVAKRVATIGQVREELETVIETMGLHRGRDLLRDYAREPDAVATKWRQKQLSRHLDQGLYYENMGLGKIDDAMLEFRRVLYLDPGNQTARDHVRKLERDRDNLVSRGGQGAAPATPSKAPAPGRPEGATVASGSAPPEDHTVVLPPGQAPPSAAPTPVRPTPKSAPAPASKPAPPPPPSRAAPPSPPPRPAPASKPAPAKNGEKRKLPMPALVGLGVLLVGIIVVAAILMTQSQQDQPTASDQATAAEPSEAPVVEPPAVSPPPAVASDTTKTPAIESPPPAATQGAEPPLQVARDLYDSGKYAEAAAVIRRGLTDHQIPKAEVLSARELQARALVRAGKPADATKVYQAMLKTSPGFRPRSTGLTDADNSAFQAALNPPAPLPAEPPASSGSMATVIVNASPFATFMIDGERKDANKPSYRTTLAPGKHTITVRHPTMGENQWEVDLKAGETKELTYDFLKSAASIDVSSKGGWGTIYIDGVNTTRVTPAVIEGVRPGKHVVSLVNDALEVDGGPKTLTLEAGDRAKIQFKLKKK